MSKKTLMWLISALLVVVGVIYLVQMPRKPGKFDAFAQCLGEKGATFYGTFWCPHCQNQKAMFGRSAKLLPYVECSTPDGKNQLPVCSELGIQGYPTWIYADGTRESGEISLERLSEATTCPLPQEDVE